jgi:hypothetical protein
MFSELRLLDVLGSPHSPGPTPMSLPDKGCLTLPDYADTE